MRNTLDRNAVTEGSIVSSIDDLLAVHPAVLAAGLRGGRVGGAAAVATLLGAVSVGAVSVTISESELRLRLVPGVATSSKPRPHGPYVRREHIAGLDRIDRELLELLFDRVAGGTTLSSGGLVTWAAAHPGEYWSALEQWRGLVSSTAARQITRQQAAAVRRTLAGIIENDSSDAQRWADAAVRAYAAGLDRQIHTHARIRPALAAGTGAGAVVSLCAYGVWPRTLLRQLRHTLSPWRPSRYLPAQHASLVLPFWYRVRSIDDGSQRLRG